MYDKVKQYVEVYSPERVTVARRILDGVVRNVYKNDPRKIAAWTSASHIEKPTKKTETPTV